MKSCGSTFRRVASNRSFVLFFFFSFTSAERPTAYSRHGGSGGCTYLFVHHTASPPYSFACASRRELKTNPCVRSRVDTAPRRAHSRARALRDDDDDDDPTTTVTAPARVVVVCRGRACAQSAKAMDEVTKTQSAQAMVENMAEMGLDMASDMCCFYTPAQWATPSSQWAAGEKMCHLPPGRTPRRARRPAPVERDRLRGSVSRVWGYA